MTIVQKITDLFESNKDLDCDGWDDDKDMFLSKLDKLHDDKAAYGITEKFIFNLEYEFPGPIYCAIQYYGTSSKDVKRQAKVLEKVALNYGKTPKNSWFAGVERLRIKACEGLEKLGRNDVLEKVKDADPTAEMSKRIDYMLFAANIDKNTTLREEAYRLFERYDKFDTNSNGDSITGVFYRRLDGMYERHGTAMFEMIYECIGKFPVDNYHSSLMVMNYLGYRKHDEYRQNMLLERILSDAAHPEARIRACFILCGTHRHEIMKERLKAEKDEKVRNYIKYALLNMLCCNISKTEDLLDSLDIDGVDPRIFYKKRTQAASARMERALDAYHKQHVAQRKNTK